MAIKTSNNAMKILLRIFILKAGCYITIGFATFERLQTLLMYY